MSRPIRIEFPNALYHVTARGDRREDIFDIRTSTNGGYVIGNHRFREQIEQMLHQRATPRERGRPRKKTVTS